MQRTRCTSFRNVTAACNRVSPARDVLTEGYSRAYTSLGTSDACVATRPSDVAVAFADLVARVHLLSPDGERTVLFVDYLLQPGRNQNHERVPGLHSSDG
jgi:xanthine dehydrogenase YagS FAD-binding subunit